MIQFIIRIGFAVIVFIFGLLMWISGDFAKIFLVQGFGRFMGGLIAMSVGAFIAFLKGD
jgi:hypothetical protein